MGDENLSNLGKCKFRMKMIYSQHSYALPADNDFNNKHFNAHYISHLANNRLAHKHIWVPTGQGQEI
jgi:hypothetical protein